LPQAESLLTIDKTAVASRFNRSAGTYDDHCRVQRLMADRLMATLEDFAAPGRILELGCGTGYLTGMLASRFPTSKIVALDFAARMVELAQNRVRGSLVDLKVADAETAVFEPGSFDLIVSNATIQWFDTPAETLARLAAALRPGGRMLHSTFGPGTFAELRSVLRAGGLPLRPADRWTSMLLDSGLEPVGCAGGSVTVNYPSAAGFLAELRATGATWRPNGSDDPPLPPGLLRSALARYDAELGTPEGVPVTYELLEVSGCRPGKTI
jgi:malonyl-CoA O-methyltransferase